MDGYKNSDIEIKCIKMANIWRLFLCNLLIFYLETTALPFYHQEDYDVKGDRVEINWFDTSFWKDVKANYYWYNRTQKALNASAYIVKENLTTDLVVEFQMYKFLSNEYRDFPLRVGLNICEEFSKNNFNVKNLLHNTSNIHNCPPPKKGYYYVHNFKPDFSLLPPYIPRGKYKGVLKGFYNKAVVLESTLYGEVLDKPLKWT